MEILVIEESLKASPAAPVFKSSITTWLNSSIRFCSHFTSSLLCTLFAVGMPLWAQQRSTAGIHGRVVDSQGGVIPGASITAVQVATNQVRTTVANTEGQFLFAVLPVGDYRFSVTHPGFKKYEQTGIVLQVNDNLRVDVTLEVGDISTSISVEASTIAVETSNATLKETVDTKRVEELPLNGR